MPKAPKEQFDWTIPDQPPSDPAARRAWDRAIAARDHLRNRIRTFDGVPFGPGPQDPAARRLRRALETIRRIGSQQQ